MFLKYGCRINLLGEHDLWRASLMVLMDWNYNIPINVNSTTYLETQRTFPNRKLCSVGSVKTVHTIHTNHSSLDATFYTMQSIERFPQDGPWILWVVRLLVLKYSCLTDSIVSYLSKTSHYICFLSANIKHAWSNKQCLNNYSFPLAAHSNLISLQKGSRT